MVDRLIGAVHLTLFSTDAEATRAFFRDVLELDSVDAGGGWPIFALPPAELGIHPTEGEPLHELFLMCDDIDATVARLRGERRPAGHAGQRRGLGAGRVRRGARARPARPLRAAPPESAQPVTTVLAARALNRALLARQGLLERSRAPALEMIERLVGMQAQVPWNPYVALWARLEDFDPEELSTLIAERRAVRAQLMRGTIHLVSARDALTMHPPSLPVLAGIFRANFARRLAGAPVEDVVRAGAGLLAEQPRTRAELAPLLAERWPEAEPASLAQAVTHHAAVVQVPPRGLWGRSGQPRLAPTEDWLGARLDGDGAEEALVLRYLAAFGPATVGDIRVWSRFTGLRAVVDRLRPRLRTFADERGRELLDVPDGSLPDPETPAPPRFLPEYDNVLLAHEERSRTLAGLGPGQPWPHGRWIGTLLADGFFRAYWKAEGGTLTVDRFTPDPADPPSLREEIVAEGERLLAFIDPGGARHRVVFAG